MIVTSSKYMKKRSVCGQPMDTSLRFTNYSHSSDSTVSGNSSSGSGTLNSVPQQRQSHPSSHGMQRIELQSGQ